MRGEAGIESYLREKSGGNVTQASKSEEALIFYIRLCKFNFRSRFSEIVDSDLIAEIDVCFCSS